MVQRTRGHFSITYPSNYDEDAEKILNFALFAQDVVENHFPEEFRINSDVCILLYEEPTYFCGILLTWNYMRSDPTKREIYLLAPSNAKIQSCFYDDIWYQANLIHEYVHLVVARFIRENTEKDMNRHYPQWFTEGIAGYVAYYCSNSEIFDKYKSRLQEMKNIIIDGEHDFDCISSEVYFGGAILVEYMYDRYGQEAIIEILRSQSRTWESVILNVLHITYSTFKENMITWALA